MKGGLLAIQVRRRRRIDHLWLNYKFYILMECIKFIKEIKMASVSSTDVNVVELSLGEENKRLLDALIVPAVTPGDKSDDDILGNLEKLVAGEISGEGGEMNSVRLLLGIRRAVKAAKDLIGRGDQRKAAVLYVCKAAILHNATDRLLRDTLLLMVDEVVPEVIEMVIDAAKHSEDYKKIVKSVGKKLCACLS